MSYYANGGGSFHVNKENFEAIKEAVRLWMQDDCEEWEPHEDIDVFFSDFGFDVELNDDGNIEDVYYPENDISYTDDFLKIIAPYVEDGSRLYMTGEDGDHWLWCFKDHRFYECQGIVIYERDPYEEES